MSRSRLAIAAVVTVAAVLLYFSLRGIEWRFVSHSIASVEPRYAAVSFALGIIPMLLRAARWRILLQAQAPVSFRTTFWAVSAGYFGNNFLPARGGELVRSYIVRERSALAVSYVLATALTERVADAVALVAVGATILLFIPQTGLWMNTARGSMIAIGTIGIIGLTCLPLLEKPALRILKGFPRLQSIIQQTALGVRSLHGWRRLLPFTALTVAIWGVDAIAVAILAHALSIALPVSVALLLIIALSLSSAFPSTPGYVGVYQFVAVTVFRPFGISPSAAIAFILVMQAMSYVLTSTLGLLAMTRFTPFNWQSFRRPLQPIQIQS